MHKIDIKYKNIYKGKISTCTQISNDKQKEKQICIHSPDNKRQKQKGRCKTKSCSSGFTKKCNVWIN